MTFVPPQDQGGYIQAPIEVDPNQLALVAFADIQAQFPGWRPIPGALDTTIIEEAALIYSIAAAVATQTPSTIFQFFGLLVGIEPIQGAPASVAATITMTDTAGYTIPAGTVVAYVQGNQQTLFTVESTVIIATGDTTAPCELVCTTVGSFPNGLPGTTFQEVTTFAQIASVISTDSVAGGVDPETSTAYMNRLSAELQLLTPRPILIGDYAGLAPNVVGVFRALAIDGLAPGRIITDAVLNGTINFTTATGNLSDIDVGRTAAGTDVFSGSTIASVSSPTAGTLSHIATGSATVAMTLGDLTSQERCVTVSGVDDTGAALSGPVDAALLAYLQGLREVNFLVFTIPPTITEIDVTVTCYADKGLSTGSVQAAVITALESYLDTATWGGGAGDPPTWDPTSNVVTFAGVANAIQGAAGVLYILSGDLTIGIHGGSMASVDVDLPGDAPLPSVGTISVTVLAV